MVSPDHSVGIVAGLAVGIDVVGTDEIQIINLGARHKLVDLDDAGTRLCP
jgi:hypothetical protein